MIKTFVQALVLSLCFALPAAAGDFLEGLKNRYRQEGAVAQSDGRLLAARNAWYKYVRLKELDPGLVSAGELIRIKNWIAETDQRLSPKEISTPLAAIAPPAPRPAVSPPPTVPLSLPRPSSQELLKKAEGLHQNGQLDEALRFYRLAEAAAPNSAEIRNKIEQLETEMN